MILVWIFYRVSVIAAMLVSLSVCVFGGRLFFLQGRFRFIFSLLSDLKPFGDVSNHYNVKII